MTRAEKDARIIQGYLASIHAQIGKTVDDFRALAAEQQLTKHADLMAWLKNDFELGHGHASAVIHLLNRPAAGTQSVDDQLAPLFTGKKAHWRAVYDDLAAHLLSFGPDVETRIGKSAVGFFRPGRFVDLHPSTAGRFDIGLKLPGVEAGGRLEAAGSWNRVVTHRVQLSDAADVDAELLGWLRQAYERS
ncbi:DUF5655 domain-containing protein [Deinococcus sp.]|uniref:DUF5655 domain-containing protein n=1 Tax=Deinococcus sp. TaxID=47478 RepID=UPI0025D07B16|nr:DUF5655 domain-containing protein [Deinococcus sp.]